MKTKKELFKLTNFKVLQERITDLELQRIIDATRILSLEGDKIIFLERLAESVPFEVLQKNCHDENLDVMCIHSVECLDNLADIKKNCPLLNKTTGEGE